MSHNGGMGGLEEKSQADEGACTSQTANKPYLVSAATFKTMLLGNLIFQRLAVGDERKSSGNSQVLDGLLFMPSQVLALHSQKCLPLCSLECSSGKLDL